MAEGTLTCGFESRSGERAHLEVGVVGTYAGEAGSLELTWRPEGAPAAGAPEMVQVGEVILLEGDAAEPGRIPVYATVEPEP